MPTSGLSTLSSLLTVLKIGGSDQWGNITAGVDLCQKLGSADSKRMLKTPSRRINLLVEVFGLTVPLLLSPSGEKFGKSAGNALFLDPTLTHPFDLYQVLHLLSSFSIAFI